MNRNEYFEVLIEGTWKKVEFTGAALDYSIDMKWKCLQLFREVYEEDGKLLAGSHFFGDTDNLYDYGEKEKPIKDYSTDNNIERLCYFGRYFGCEPYGIKPSELKNPCKLVFDVELSKKLHKVA